MSWSGYADDSQQAAASLLQRAQQGDMAAAQQLQQAAQSWAPNHRNSAIDAWNQLNPDTGDDLSHIKNPHKGLGGILGSALRFAAPLAGALIPGVGFAGGALIGGLGNAGGQLLSGGHVNPLESLGAGAAGGFGNKLLGNGLGSGSSNWGFGSSMPQGFGNTTAMGNAGGQGAGQYADPGMSGGSQGGGLLDSIFGGGSWLDKAMQAGGMFGAIKGQHDATSSMNNAMQGAQHEWDSRQPLRDMAMSGIQGLGQIQAPDLTSTFADPGNPFYHAPLTPAGRPERPMRAY